MYYPIISQKEVRIFYVIIFLCSDKLYNISAKVSFFKYICNKTMNNDRRKATVNFNNCSLL